MPTVYPAPTLDHCTGHLCNKAIATTTLTLTCAGGTSAVSRNATEPKFAHNPFSNYLGFRPLDANPKDSVLR